VRLLNQDVIDLYNRVPIGTKVVVLGDEMRGPGGVPLVDFLFPGTASAAAAPAPAAAPAGAAPAAPTPPKTIGAI
jgi:hypothetical protein